MGAKFQRWWKPGIHRLLPGVILCLLTLIAVPSCRSGDDEQTGSEEAASTKALAELFASPADRAKIEVITRKLWEGLEPHGCMSCHSTSQGPGWENMKMPYFDFWKSAIVVHLDLVDTEVSQVAPTNFKLYRQLSGDVAPVMPPRNHGLRSEPGALVLDAVEGFASDDLSRLANATADCQDASTCRAAVVKALGEAPVFTNRRGVCIDNSRLQRTRAPSLCEAFSDLSKFIATWKETPKKGAEAWLEVVKKAARINHYDSDEGVIADDSNASSGASGPVVAGSGGTVVGKGRVLFAMPGDSTISFYTRVAPDDTALALTETGPQKFAPKIVDLSRVDRQIRLSNINYDPTFSPDYSLATKTGFVVGARGFNLSETAKIYSFFTPGTNGNPIFSATFDEISGYGSVAHITQANASQVADRWKKIWESQGDYYVLMGKRWKWTAFKTVVGANGTEGIKILTERAVGLPGGSGVASPVCDRVTDATGRGDTAVAFAESMLSGDGRFIALNSQMDGALILVNTKTCAIEHAPSIQGKPLQGSKAAFSMDGDLVAFHAWGETGLSPAQNGMANNGAIRNLANAGRISNIFVYDTRTKQTRQITDYKTRDKTVAWFPNFNGDASKLYYHRHRADQSASEVLVIELGN